MKNALIVLTLLLTIIVRGVPTTAQDAPSVGVLKTVALSDGRTGSYLLYSPAGLATDAPAPLLIALHGRMSNIRALEATSHLNQQADAGGFRVAYVQANDYSWQDGWKEAGVVRYETTPGDDIGLLTTVETDIRTSVSVSDLYYVGFDTGGHMALRMMCERGKDIAGIVLVASLPWNYWSKVCPETVTIGRVLILHGDLDLVHDPAGFDSPDNTLADGSALHQLGREELLRFFIERAGCTDGRAVEQLRVLTDCADGGDVTLVTIPAGGHEWFHAGDYGINQTEADAGALIGQWLAGDLTEVTLLTRAPAGAAARTHQLFLPGSYDGAQALPLVIGLHGRTDSGAGFALLSEMDKVAEAEGFALAFPDGLGHQWNYLGDFVPTERFHSPNDIAYLEYLIDDIALDVNIDRQRVYLMGFSNGAFMTYRIACETTHPFAGFGVISGLMYTEFEPACVQARPVPIVIFHGTQDTNVNWNGLTHGSPDGSRIIFDTRSALESVSFWATHNQCTLDNVVKTTYDLQADTQTQVIRFDFETCADEARVRFYAISNAGHTWPGGTLLGADFGRTALDLNASQALWDFFSETSPADASDAAGEG